MENLTNKQIATLCHLEYKMTDYRYLFSQSYGELITQSLFEDGFVQFKDRGLYKEFDITKKGRDYLTELPVRNKLWIVLENILYSTIKHREVVRKLLELLPSEELPEFLVHEDNDVRFLAREVYKKKFL